MKRKSQLLSVLGVLFLLQAGGVSWSQTTERVSIDSVGSDADSASYNPSTSANGRYVAFESDATDLVAGDTNSETDIFVHDRQTGTTTRVSIHSDGTTQGDGPSSSASISADGRYVAFESQADNLIVGDTNLFPFSDLLLHDRQTRTTTLVSVDSTDIQRDGPSSSASISADGRYVAFESEANLVVGDIDLHDIFVRDLVAGTTTLVSVDSTGTKGNLDSYAPSISSDGRYVAFESLSTNLVAPVTNGKVHIFVRDLVAGTTTLVSVDSTDVQGNGDSSSASISDDGRYVAFVSDADNLLGVGNDNNVSADVFVHDLQTGTTTRVSVNSAGTEGNDTSSDPSISANAKYVAFESDATSLVAVDNNNFFDIFVYERESLPPTVTLTNPVESATNVAVDADIAATFSEAMQASTITPRH
jgi:Tol biopolymer transport system component